MAAVTAGRRRAAMPTALRPVIITPRPIGMLAVRGGHIQMGGA
jgi:hypothetical protein